MGRGGSGPMDPQSQWGRTDGPPVTMGPHRWTPGHNQLTHRPPPAPVHDRKCSRQHESPNTVLVPHSRGQSEPKQARHFPRGESDNGGIGHHLRISVGAHTLLSRRDTPRRRRGQSGAETAGKGCGQRVSFQLPRLQSNESSSPPRPAPGPGNPQQQPPAQPPLDSHANHAVNQSTPSNPTGPHNTRRPPAPNSKVA